MKALIYRPNSRWQIVSAFTVAAAIHLSAVAWASLHRDIPATFSGTFTEVEVEPSIGEVPPEPPPEEALPVQETISPSEFVETETPAVHKISKRSTPIASGRPSKIGIIRGSSKALALCAPRPDYPYEARRRSLAGSGAALLTIDPTTGSVLGGTMSESTGSPILDNSALSAFRRWRFKPGTPSPVRIEVTFTLSGAVGTVF